jgi:SAM-dependent methyltransferase
MTILKIFDNENQEKKLLEKSIKNLYDGKTELIILEAGCGRNWPLNLSEIKYKLIGVDLDEEALKSRVLEKKDLDEAIVADLQFFDIGNRNVDVIYNSFVLEHVENAELMLENFIKILKPGGLLIIKLPDRNTVFGFITRITPFWFHIIYYKFICNFKDAGKPGFGPYPTYYNKIVSRNGIQDFCQAHGLLINEEYGFCTYANQNNIKNTVKNRLVRVIAFLVSKMSLGILPWKYNDLTYVITKS